jgi:hypothetical protein
MYLPAPCVGQSIGVPLPPPLKLRLPLAPHSHFGLLLLLAMKRLDLVEQAKEARVVPEDVLAHLPEVPRRPLAGFRVRDRAPRIAGQASEARLGESSGLP